MAVLDSRNECVWSQLVRELGPAGPKKTKPQKMVEQMLALLEQSVPANGPRPDTPFSKSLEDNIFEFRVGYGKNYKGPKLRVVYFYGKERRMIVCAESIWKRGESMGAVKRRAMQTRRQYLADYAKGDVQIFDLDEHEEPS